MRIAWILYGSLEQRTGGTIYDARVVDGLRRAGDDVHVVSLEEDDDRATTETEEAGVALAERIRALDVDVVVGDELCFRELATAFHALGHDSDERGGQAARRPRRVLLVHHLTAWEFELSPMQREAVRVVERRATETADAVIVTSRTTRERLVREGVEEAIAVVLPGADRLGEGEDESGREGGSERAVRFVFVGAVVGRKRVLELVRAFGRGARRRGRLAIVGSTTRDAAYVERVRDEIARLELGERIVMHGEVDETAVARVLATADALVMPSTLEGYGIAATEAIHAGVPVIAARAQGLEEALAPCPEAALFADDEDALASALDRFTNDDALRAAMRDAARDAASRMPTWASCAAQFRAALLA